jgi:hypothetical protein
LVLAVPTACGRREPRAAATVLLQVGFGVEERLREFFESTPSRQAHQWTTPGMYLAEIYWYLRVFVSSDIEYLYIFSKLIIKHNDH